MQGCIRAFSRGDVMSGYITKILPDVGLLTGKGTDLLCTAMHSWDILLAQQDIACLPACH
jgi:hypothetical protein